MDIKSLGAINIRIFKGELMATDLLLINPGSWKYINESLANNLASIEPPLWCALLAAIVREKQHSVKIIDAELNNYSPEKIISEINNIKPTFIGIIVMGNNPSASSTPKMVPASIIHNTIKANNPDQQTFFYGLHPSALPERTINDEKCNFIIQGDGFSSITLLMESINNNTLSTIPNLWYKSDNKIQHNHESNSLTDLDDIPMAAWDLLPMEKYRAHNWHCFDNIENRTPYGVIFTSLGCPYSCTYCNINKMYTGKPGIRFRKPEQVLDEIKFLNNKYKIRNLKFFDELFALKETHVTEICNLIIREKMDLNIWAYARVDTVSKRILPIMKKAGINWLAYGFESANQKVRQGVSKKFNQLKMIAAANMTRNENINIIGNFIFGLPDDDIETMNETLHFAEELNLEYINFYTAMAYPGSKLYKESIDKNIALPKSWDGYSQYSQITLPLPTKYITSKQVLTFRDHAFEHYFKRDKYLSMISQKFGTKVVNEITEMLKYKIKRKE
jgi:radical SAM superfamily enzyme YgiQ (UPF0313 family)